MGQPGVLENLDMVVFLSSNNYGIQVCETKNSINYKIVSDSD